MCELRPRLKTDEEIIAAFREEMKDDLAIIEGSDEQADMLEAIDAAEGQGSKFYSKSAGGVEYIDLPNDDQKVREKLTNEMATRGINADFNESSKETIEYIPKLHDKVANDFPKIGEVLRDIWYTADRSLLNEMEDEGSLYHSGEKKIFYNKTIYNNKDNLLAYIDIGQFASGEISGQMAHEYGHAIASLTREKSKLPPETIDKMILTLLYENDIKTIRDIEREISGYALEEGIDGIMAESISNALTAKTPNPICIKIYDMLKLLNGGI